MRLGIWPVRKEAEAVALRLQEALGGSLFRPWEGNHLSQKDRFHQEFFNFDGWVLVMAAGIAVRFLSGLIENKHQDPAVVVVDEAARHAISLLSGHEGGANRLTVAVANAVSATPVVTTAGETLKPLILGIGCRRGISANTIELAVTEALGDRKIDDIREVVTIDLKAREPGLLEFCARHNLSLRWFSKDAVIQRKWTTHPSGFVAKITGADGVCEPCALMASPRALLVVPKTTRQGVAIAVAEDTGRTG